MELRTIALSPQLLPLEPDEAEAAEANARIRAPGPWEEAPRAFRV